MAFIGIAVDGPSGSGKSTLAKMLAKRLGFVYVDTGAMYRSVGLFAFRNDVMPDDRTAVAGILKNITLDIRYIDGAQHVFMNGEDVSEAIRDEKMSVYASAVSKHPEVRAFLFDRQREAATKGNVIMDGRDIGTVILPNADVKIFLTAADEVRAMRRFNEQREKGRDVTFEQVLADMRARDLNDSTREEAPAVAAPDAVVLDNGGMSLDETVEAALNIIKNKIGG